MGLSLRHGLSDANFLEVACAQAQSDGTSGGAATRIFTAYVDFSCALRSLSSDPYDVIGARGVQPSENWTGDQCSCPDS
jgi:hypothetical protein